MHTASNINNECEANKPDHQCHDRYDRTSDDVRSISMGRKRRQLSDHPTIFQYHHSLAAGFQIVLWSTFERSRWWILSSRWWMCGDQVRKGNPRSRPLFLRATEQSRQRYRHLYLGGGGCQRAAFLSAQCWTGNPFGSWERSCQNEKESEGQERPQCTQEETRATQRQ